METVVLVWLMLDAMAVLMLLYDYRYWYREKRRAILLRRQSRVSDRDRYRESAPPDGEDREYVDGLAVN